MDTDAETSNDGTISESDSLPGKTKKRPIHPSQWKQVARKKAKNSGEEYVTAKGKLVEKVKMRAPCACKFDCKHRISEQQRQKIFKDFWELGCHNRQWDFIRKHSRPSASREKDKEVERKFRKRNYFFVVDGKEIKICKLMFLNTLSVGDSWVDSAYSHVSNGEEVIPDKRGRHDNHCKQITEKMVEAVLEHIAKFPRVPSQYCHQTTTREYLESGLSISKMARLYSTWAKSNNYPSVTSRQYRDILKDNTNIAFDKTRKDRCNICNLMGNKNNMLMVREKYKKAWFSHLKNKKISREFRDRDKLEAVKNDTIAVCSFDLLKQLQCPKTECEWSYYRNKLSIFNFTLFNVTARLGTCYVWHEGIGKKGSKEVASCLYNYFTSLVESGAKDIRVYSDNCAGQNKNRLLFSMYLHVAARFGIKITHRYFEAGHTQMESDSIQGRIETATTKHEIFTLDDWISAAEQAKEQLPKYVVTKMERSMMYDLEGLVASLSWDKDETGNTVKWRKIRELAVDGAEGPLVRLKYDFNGQTHTVAVATDKASRPIDLKNFTPPLACSELLPISPQLREDLQWMIDSDAIPAKKQAFIKEVLSRTYAEENIEATEPEYETDEELFTDDDLIDEVLTKGTADNHGEDSDDLSE